MKVVEITISIIAFLTIWILLAIHGSGPIFSDELLYTDIGLRNLQVPDYGNRYFHVYAQKLFMALAPTPLSGVKIFWGFIVALTALLVYWNARNFFKHSTALHGLLAVGFFFSYRFISQYCGDTAADISAMTMTTILLSLYLYYLRSGRTQRWAVFALGLVVFLGFKTKETTIFGDAILLGLFFDEEGKFSFKNILPIIKPFLLGVAGGIGVFIILDSIFLHSPFFAINPSTFATVVNHYDYQGYFKAEPSSYYTVYLLVDLMVPFLLYLLSGVKNYGIDETISKKIVWLFPLLLALFMTLNQLKIIWGFLERFYFPALPVIAILAPQFINFDELKTFKDKFKQAALLLAGLVLVVVLRQVFTNVTENMAWDYGHFLDTIFVPVVLSALLIIAILVKKFNWWSSVIPATLIVSLLMAPWLFNEKYIFRIPFTVDYFNQLYYPFVTNKDAIQYRSDMQFYFSGSLETQLQMLSSDRNEFTAMFNIFFNGRASDKNFTLEMKPISISDDIAARRFDYVLITEKDWELVSANLGTEQKINQTYQQYPDPKNQVMLLKAKPS